MSAIWNILIDTSGSMGKGFAQRDKASLDPLTQHGAWQTKLEAAKEVLIRRISALRVQDIALYQFNSQPKLLYRGNRAGMLDRQDIIDNLSAGGQTSIDVALDEVSSSPYLRRYQSASVLVISDGLSDPRAAEVSAKRLVNSFPSSRIDTILIDETEKGRRVAELISINGSVYTVESSIQLGEAAASARAAALRNELSGMALYRFQAQSELATLQSTPPPRAYPER